ncbi:MAG: dTDP-4-dehydrorhamnose 3,5-epimerase [Chlamydiales bacterium]|nr:dTDP-4-dehydrorhamnose 3,5-epimerase [Chlamydiales bacterium]
MQIEELVTFPEVKKIKLDVWSDNRGFFLEWYQQDKLHKLGIPNIFVQSNHSFSKKNVIRGMHFQTTPGQSKLVYVPIGHIYDVIVDVRLKSKTFGRWQAIHLREEEPTLLFVPAGFAHGFCVLSEQAHVIYQVDSFYNPHTEKGFHYADPMIKINWLIDTPIVSEKDKQNSSLKEVITCIG